ncbi:MAG TPA: hypothetical protein VLI04_07360 [Nocardioidaceae bacterium]|nr:hypothetical protein [Nocardioidaceae bacterium]
MRGTAVAVALVLLLGGCSGDGEKEELPEPGPLVLLENHSCEKRGHDYLFVAATAKNTAEIPLTIDEVRLEGEINLEFRYAMLEREDLVAVDQTMPQVGQPGAQQPLILKLRFRTLMESARYASVVVEYHNVEGRYESVADGADVRVVCLG